MSTCPAIPTTTSARLDVGAPAASMERLLLPERVALIGAHSRESGLGSRTFRHLMGAEFVGEVQRLAAASEVASGTDVAVVAVPAKAVAAVLAELGGRAANVVVYSSGFGEIDAPTLRGAAAPGVRLLGPNTVGVYYAPSRLVLTFAAAFDDLLDCPSGSRTIMVSRSGAFGARILTSARRRGLSIDGFVATGNEDDWSASDVIAALVESERLRPRTILVYVEGIGDGARLREALTIANDAGVAVVVLPGGRTPRGAAAAKSHTAAASPDSEVFAEVCAMHGATLVASDRQLVDSAIALASAPRARGRRVAVLTGSGGAGVVAADLLVSGGVLVPTLGAATRRALADELPDFAACDNPVDVTAQAIGDTAAVQRCVEILGASGEVDVVLAVGRHDQAAACAGTVRSTGVPVVMAVLDGDAASTAPFVRDAVPLFPDIEAAVRGVAALTPARRDSAAFTLPSDTGIAAAVGAPSRGAPADAAGCLDVMSAAGIEVAPWHLVSTVEAAAAAAKELGPVVVVKANVAGRVHKAQAGAVRLDVTTDEIDGVARAMLELADTVIVASQVRGSPEYFVGARRDATFGPIIVIGLGGSAMHLIDRSVSVPADAGPAWIVERLRRLRIVAPDAGDAPLIALADVARRLAGLLGATDTVIVECNPLVPVDGRLVALDARVLAADE